MLDRIGQVLTASWRRVSEIGFRGFLMLNSLRGLSNNV